MNINMVLSAVCVPVPTTTPACHKVTLKYCLIITVHTTFTEIFQTANNWAFLTSSFININTFDNKIP